ncbi:MAG: hypothetical protein AAF729_07030, partial [Pseudomonadota bacterium]
MHDDDLALPSQPSSAIKAPTSRMVGIKGRQSLSNERAIPEQQQVLPADQLIKTCMITSAMRSQCY